MSRTRSFSLRAKWTVVLLLVTLVPLVAIALVIGRIQRRGLERAEKELEVAVVDEVAASLGNVLTEASDTTDRVGQLLADDRINEDARLALAEEALARCDSLESVAVYDAEGHFIDAITHGVKGTSPKPAGDKEAPMPDLPEVVRHEDSHGSWVADVHAHAGADLRYVEPMSHGGKVRGWVAGHLVPGALSARVGQISRDRFESPDRVLVVDSALQIIASEATDTLGLGQDLEGRDIFAAVPLTGRAFQKEFGLTTEFESADRVLMVGTVRTMPDRGWAVVARRPQAEAFDALTAARRAFLLVIGLVATVGVVSAAWLAGRTTAPIASLVALTRAYGRREFAKKSDVHSNDELEELGSSLTEMAVSLASSEVEIARRATVEAALSRYLPEEVAKAVAGDASPLALGGARKDVSIVFADVAAFTSFSERSDPERVVSFLNELFSILTEVVFRHGGMVDKFIGDCIMAVFTTSDEPGASSHVLRAVAAAEDMHRFVETHAAAWKVAYDFDVRLGIGVASGPALVGNLGSDKRVDYTAIGDTVNVASRLETLARPGQTLVTVAVSDAATGAFHFNPLGLHAVRGKKEPVEIFELGGEDAD